MYIEDGFQCCGLGEISGLSDYRKPELALKSLFRDSGDGLLLRQPHLIFTQAGRGATYGKRFAAYLVKEGLGTVVATPSKTNPNSGNPLVAWIWTTNKKALKKWGVTHNVKSAEARDSDEYNDNY